MIVKQSVYLFISANTNYISIEWCLIYIFIYTYIYIYINIYIYYNIYIYIYIDGGPDPDLGWFLCANGAFAGCVWGL